MCIGTVESRITSRGVGGAHIVEVLVFVGLLLGAPLDKEASRFAQIEIYVGSLPGFHPHVRVYGGAAYGAESCLHGPVLHECKFGRVRGGIGLGREAFGAAEKRLHMELHRAVHTLAESQQMDSDRRGRTFENLFGQLLFVIVATQVFRQLGRIFRIFGLSREIDPEEFESVVTFDEVHGLAFDRYGLKRQGTRNKSRFRQP